MNRWRSGRWTRSRRIVVSLLLGASLTGVGPAGAHPAVSLVLDSHGNLYFSDLESVRVLRPDGTIELVMSGVHTHELWIGPDGALYGEDVTNVGDDYRHRVWRLDPDGTITDVIPWREGFPDEYHDYGFGRDASGASYVLRRGDRLIEVRGADGDPVRAISLDEFEGFVHWLTVHPGGRVHVGVGSDLLTVPPGGSKAVVVARGLVERTEEFDWLHDRHAIMGLWTDAKGNVYVSVYAGQVLKRVSPAGDVSVVSRSPGDWSPVGGTSAVDGTVWILEWSASNEVRIRRLGPDGSERVFASR